VKLLLKKHWILAEKVIAGFFNFPCFMKKLVKVFVLVTIKE